jgi:hypothetical protein
METIIFIIVLWIVSLVIVGDMRFEKGRRVGEEEGLHVGERSGFLHGRRSERQYREEGAE